MPDGIIKCWKNLNSNKKCKRPLINARLPWFLDSVNKFLGSIFLRRDELYGEKFIHYAHYAFEDGTDKDYWRDEHIDEENKACWRHYDFMSIPCRYCGAYSPIRSHDDFSSVDSKVSCGKEDIIDHRPTDTLPDTLAYHRENGWCYIYFKETLSDSLDGQETFRLKSDPAIYTPPSPPTPE